MKTKTKIALSLPSSGDNKRYFAFRLKQDMYDEPCEYDKPEKIFALSDIEGNFKAFAQLLIKNGIVDKYLGWTFEEGHLVIIGDCFDRGEQVAECLWLIYSLEEKARRRGGYVHFILGNHEIMNLNGDWRYTHPKYAQSSKTPSTALYSGNNELWQWLCTKNIMERIGNTLFVHGGIAEEIVQTNLSIVEINNLARPYYTRAWETFSDPFLQTIFNGENSPLWFRGYYHDSITEKQVDNTLHYFHVKNIVTGHTIVEQVTAFFNGKVINTNTDHAAGISEALLIKNEKFYRVDSKGQKTKII